MEENEQILVGIHKHLLSKEETKNSVPENFNDFSQQFTENEDISKGIHGYLLSKEETKNSVPQDYSEFIGQIGLKKKKKLQ